MSFCPADCRVPDSVVDSLWWAFIGDVTTPTLWAPSVCSSPISPHLQSSNIAPSKPLTHQPNHLPQLRTHSTVLAKAISLSSQTGRLKQCLQLCPWGEDFLLPSYSFQSPLSGAVMQNSLFSGHTNRPSQPLHELGLDFLFFLCQLVIGNPWPSA